MEIVFILFMIFFILVMIFTQNNPLYQSAYTKKRVIKHEAKKYFNDAIKEFPSLSLLVSKFSGDNIRLSGKIEGFKVKLSTSLKKEDDHYNCYIQFNISIKRQKDLGLYISKIDKSMYMVNDGSTSSGDASFDKEFKMEAYDKSTIPAFLTSRIRKKILKIKSEVNSFYLSNTEVAFNAKANSYSSSNEMIRHIYDMIDFAKHISKFNCIKDELIRNIHDNDDNAYLDIRMFNLKYLLEKYPIDEEINNCLLKCLNDPSVFVQIEAAKHLREKGARHAVSMFNTYKTLRSSSIIDLLKILRGNNFTSGVPVLLDVYSRTDDIPVKLELLKTFKKFKDESVSPLLEKEIFNDDNEIRDRAIKVLEECGTIHAVEKLYKLQKKTLNPITRNSIQKSIEVIQSRLGDVEKGWLSVTEVKEADGALSLSSDAGEGSMSVAEQEEE